VLPTAALGSGFVSTVAATSGEAADKDGDDDDDDDDDNDDEVHEIESTMLNADSVRVVPAAAAEAGSSRAGQVFSARGAVDVSV
jgi:hypothetical protein